MDLFNKYIRKILDEDFLFEERQSDIDAFEDKFGAGSFEKFSKVKQRIINAKKSPDIVYRTKNTSVSDMEKLLNDAEKRRGEFSKLGEKDLLRDENGKIYDNKIKVAENEHYTVYDILDWQTSVNMGMDTGCDGSLGWCISGRYNKDGTLSIENAKKHWEDYISGGVKHFLFFIPKGNEEKWAMTIGKSGRFVFTKGSDDTNLGMGEVPENAGIFPDFEYGGVDTNGIFVDALKPDENGVLIYNGGRVARAYRDKVKEVVVVDGVVSIDERAFQGCRGLAAVTIPSSVTNIGDSAFFGCTRLKSVYITDLAAWCGISFGNSGSNPCIHDGNLYLNNTLLTDLVIPSQVTRIWKYAFRGCSSLTHIEIPPSVTTIGDFAFANCRWLTTVMIPSSVDDIGFSTFYDCHNLTIHCKKDSYADKYAQENGIPVKYDMNEDFDEETVKSANKTARSAGASAIDRETGEVRSVVARYILDNADKSDSILDYGAGPKAIQSKWLVSKGFENVTAYDFGENVVDGVHDRSALSRSYDVVFASNVINTENTVGAVKETLKELWNATRSGGRLVFNYPSTPRKCMINGKPMSTSFLESMVKNVMGENYDIIGSKSAPIFVVYR